MSRAEIKSRRGPHKMTMDVEEAFEEEMAQEIKQKEVDKEKIKELLKNKAKKEKTEMVEVIEKKDRALEWFVVGCGQGGSRIAETFYDNGYNAVAINTSIQDLSYINMLNDDKYKIDYAKDGAAKDLSIGEDAFIEMYDKIKEFIDGRIPNNVDMIILFVIGGGVTGCYKFSCGC